MILSCDDFENHIAAFIDGELDEADRLRFESHWHSCDACGEIFVSLFEDGATLVAPALSRDRSDALWKQIEASIRQIAPPAAARPSKAPRRSFMLVAAAAAVLVSLGSWLLLWEEPRENPLEAQKPTPASTLPNFELEEIEVGDGYTFFMQPNDEGAIFIISQLGD